MKRVGVLGSINTDFVAMSKELPKEGETVKGEKFSVEFGGKGANKAVALSRLGLQVVMFGAVGDDDFSKRCLANLEKEGVSTKFIKRFRGNMCGIANIYSSKKTNMIVSVPGANEKIDAKYVKTITKEIMNCDVVVADLEVPKDVVLLVSEICQENGVTFVLNPSPVEKINKKLLKNGDFVVVNEVEIQKLPGYKTQQQILKDFGGRLILTLGKNGAEYYSKGQICHTKAFNVKVVDTTGAGDSFLGGLIWGLLEGKEIDECVRFANACASLKITKLGAQKGMPKLTEVQKILKKIAKK